MNRVDRFVCLLLIISSVTSICAQTAKSQPAPDFSGKWLLDVTASTFGRGRKLNMETYTIKQSANRITINSVTEIDRQVINLVVDGKDHPASSISVPFDVTARSHWEGGTLIAEFRQSGPMPSNWTSRYHLSPDGRELVVDKGVSPGNGISDFEQHFVFRKQP